MGETGSTPSLSVSNLPSLQALHLSRNYGFLAREVCELGKESDLLKPFDRHKPFLKAEVLYSVRNEMSQTIADVLARRMRVAFVDSEAAKGIVQEVRMFG